MQRAAALETRRGADVPLTGTTPERAGEGALHDMVWAKEVPSVVLPCLAPEGLGVRSDGAPQRVSASRSTDYSTTLS